MALDFHRSDTDEYLFGLNDEQYTSLQEIFTIFYQRTGLQIDQYKDMKLTTENCQTLLHIIDKSVQQADLNRDKKKTTVILEFSGLLNYFNEKGIDFHLHGD